MTQQMNCKDFIARYVGSNASIQRTCITQDILLVKLRDILESKLVRLQSKQEVAVGILSFLGIVEFYLASIAVEDDGIVMTQKEGICISTAVAPFLAELPEYP